MTSPLIRSFERFEDALQARDSLITGGMPAGAVQLRVIEDEAGPVEGNFVSGNGRTSDGKTPAMGVLAGGDIPYDSNFANTVSRGVHLLIVEAADDTQRQQAESVLSRYQSMDVAAAAEGRPR